MSELTLSVDEEKPWYGPAYPNDGWVPAPRYLLRRARILSIVKKLHPGELLEIGSASGALLCEIEDQGFTCTGLETSERAIALARKLHGSFANNILTAPNEAWGEEFDYCVALEVLEHIEDDVSALREWSGWIKPGGQMILSVPAHPKLWNARDVWAGHFRRYRKNELADRFERAGFSVEKIECYGFPLANVLELLFAGKAPTPMTVNPDDRGGVDKQAQTAQSGVERGRDVKLFSCYAKFPGSWVMRAMIAVQNLFLKTNLGNGYIVVATKR